MSKRVTISNNIRWVRYILALFIPGLIGDMIRNPENWQVELVLVLVLALLTFLLYRMRKVQFDDENIYRVYGNKKKTHPYSSLISIIRSGRKVNNRRMWRITYRDDERNKDRNFHILEGTFRHGSINDFIKRAMEANPSIELERSHFWDQVNRSLKKED